jgi:hypothetical protein
MEAIVECILIGEVKSNFILIFKKNCWITTENTLKEETGKTLNK